MAVIASLSINVWVCVSVCVFGRSVEHSSKLEKRTTTRQWQKRGIEIELDFSD